MNRPFRQTLAALSLFTMAAAAQTVAAAPQCTDEPREKWQDAQAFQQSLEKKGYKIKTFLVTDGNCYEVYGWDKAGKKVEIYFNPVDGSVVKSNVEK